MSKANDNKARAAQLAEEAERNLAERIRASGEATETAVPIQTPMPNEWVERNKVIKSMIDEIERLRPGGDGGAVMVFSVRKDLTPGHLFHIEGGDATWYTLLGLLDQVQHMLREHFIEQQRARLQQEAQRPNGPPQ